MTGSLAVGGGVPHPIAPQIPEGGVTVNRTAQRRHDALAWVSGNRAAGVYWPGGLAKGS